MKFTNLDEFHEYLFNYLKNNLQINIKTTSEYTGGFDGRSLYEDSHRIQVILEGEVISEAYLN